MKRQIEKPWYRELHWQIFIGLFMGCLVGVILRSTPLPEDYFVPVFDMGGKIFLRLLKMVVLPLVIASLLLGVMSVGSIKELSRLGSRTMIYYVITSLLAITVGLIFVNAISPGTKVLLEIEGLSGKSIETPTSIFDILLRMIPENPFSSMAAIPFDMLAVLFFVIIFGIFSLQVSSKQRKPIADFAESLNAIMLKMVEGVLVLAPYGVFCLVADLVSEMGLKIFASLGWYLITVILALCFHFFVVIPLIYFFIKKENPFRYMKQMSSALLTAFSSASSAATLSLTYGLLAKK